MIGEKKKKNAQILRSPVSLEIYKALVDRCARERLNYPIANGSAVHARILINKLFDIAESDVNLITGSLRQVTRDGAEIYAHPGVISSAKKFLGKPSSSLSIVIQAGTLDGDLDNKFIREVVNDDSRRGEVTIFVPKVGVLPSAETPHFMVSDRLAYRFETGEDASPDRESIAAVANFGDSKSAEILSEIFSTATAIAETDDNLQVKHHFEGIASRSS